MTKTPIVVMLAILSSAAAGWAQGTATTVDPIIGSWKLNPALTNAPPSVPFRPPAARTEVYRINADTIELTVTTPLYNGSAATNTMVYSARGGVVTQQSGPPGQMLIETRIAPGHWQVTYLTNGQQTLTMEKTVSGDGKTMRQVVTGVSLQGVPFEGLIVFERQ